MISGIFTALLMLAFFIMVGWAWSDRRTEEFDHMANLPLEDNDLDKINKEGEQHGNV